MIGRPIRNARDLPPLLFRQEDVDECAAAGLSIDEALDLSIASSDEAFVIIHETNILGVWGYRRDPHSPSVADVWLLTTPKVELFPKAFVKESKRLRDVLNSEFQIIRGNVHGAYASAVRWLEVLGFTPVVADAHGFFTMIRSA